ncbi:MAG TPA: immunity protein YezG family protein [Advenella sp.]|nr:immunity protein YezG family protein [Advenella sp.]
MSIESLNNLHSSIASNIFEKSPAKSWASGICTVKIIYGYMEGQIIFSRDNEEVSTSGVGGKNYLLIEKLRAAMAEVNQGRAWYTMVVTVQEDGKFKFDFDYDHLPTFDILPDPEDWEKEFKAYPNPALQAHVQDWMDGRVKDEDWRTVIQRLRDLNPSSNL